MIEGTSRPRLAAGVRLQEDKVRGRWVVQAPERMIVPDDIALAILYLLDGERSLDAVVDELAGRYAAPRQEIAADVTAMLEELAAKGIVTW